MVTGFLWRRRWDSNPRGAHHAKTISSRSRYDHFDTSPYMSARHFSQPFFDEKGLWKELTERTANLFNFRTVENPHGYKVFGGRNGQLPARFRVRPVMTTSIRFHLQQRLYWIWPYLSTKNHKKTAAAKAAAVILYPGISFPPVRHSRGSRQTPHHNRMLFPQPGSGYRRCRYWSACHAPLR